MKEVSTREIAGLRQELRARLQRKIHEAIETLLDEELSETLGAGKSERGEERRGYRHGSRTRKITTANGEVALRVPRGRLFNDESSEEYRSEILPRYARRTREVDEAILGCYLAGSNSRRIRKALAPMLGEAHLSKSAVSRIVGRLKELFDRWRGRDLSKERYALLYLDGFHLKVRLARRVVSAPVLAVLGVDETGQKRLVALQLAVSEHSAQWSALIENLGRRSLPAPHLVVSDGHAGLVKALKTWTGIKVQRCTVHKRRNLEKHCPLHARAELNRDYSAIVDAEDGMAAREAYRAFVAKWSKLRPAVATSLEEAGEQLLTFYEFPKPLWKAIRSTNSLENLNREFRRRTKTQSSFSTEDAALTLLFALVAFGQIQMRRLDGYRELPSILRSLDKAA